MKEKKKNYEKGITLIALVITIIVLLILAGVTLRIVMNGGIINKSQTAVDKYDYEEAKEKLTLALWDCKMGVISGGDTNLQSYLDKINAEITDTTDTEYVIELDGYEFIVDKITLKIISGTKSGGVKPIVDVSIYQQDGSKIVEGEKYETLALTVKVSNKKELISIDEITLKNEKGNIINPTENVIGDSTADKSFIINKNGKYTSIVKGTKDEIQKIGKKEIEVNSITNIIYTVSYTNGIDNMNLLVTYDKTKETSTSEEQTKLNEIKAKDSATIYNRAVKNDNETITAIAEELRTNNDEQIYLYGRYNVNKNKTYSWNLSKNVQGSGSIYNTYGYPNMSLDYNKGTVTISGSQYSVSKGGKYQKNDTGYIKYSASGTNVQCAYYTRSETINYSKGNFISNEIGNINEYPLNGQNNGLYWYVRNELMKKYRLYKYDEELNLKSIYDVESKEIKTIPIDISNKESNRIMLEVNTTGNDYKVYLSGDNSNWQEVENITSGTPKEIELSDWNNLYIKIETNSSTINDIQVEYAE